MKRPKGWQSTEQISRLAGIPEERIHPALTDIASGDEPFVDGEGREWWSAETAEEVRRVFAPTLFNLGDGDEESTYHDG